MTPSQFVGASPQIEFGTTNDDGYLQNTTTIGTALSDGAYFDGTNWIATKASAVILQASAAYGGFSLNTDTGLVIGSPFAPTQRAYYSGPGNPWAFVDKLTAASLPSADATNAGILTAGAQTLPPNKTLTGTTTFTTTSVAGAENIAIFGVSGDATNNVTIANTSGSASLFNPLLTFKGAGANQACIEINQGTTDSGGQPIREFRFRIGASSAVATRPQCQWTNNGTVNMALAANGSLAISGGSAAGLTVGASGTKITQTRVYSQALTPSSVAANTTAEQTFTVTGLTTADKVTINPGAAPTAGTGIVGVRVSAADTLAVTYSNNTAGGLTPVSSTCLILATRS